MPNLREYSSRFGLTPERAKRLGDNTLVMHPGPMNRGVEILVDPAEIPGAMITKQVTNGVAVRMAVLFDLLRAATESVDDGEWARDPPDLGRPDRRPVRRANGRRADRRRPGRDGRIRRRRQPTRPCSTRRDASSLPASSTSTPTCREPGREDAETIETGSRAAALGGYTAVVAMPNTDPAADSRDVVELRADQGGGPGLCDVHPSACITVGRAGEQLAPFGELVGAGVRIFTDDGTGVQDPLLMRRAMEYSLGLDMVLAQHCEVAALTKGAVMHEGHCCSELGLPGWPSIAEELMVHRDIELARLTGARIHILHLSTAGSVELVRRAKADGLPGARPRPHRTTSASPTSSSVATTRCSRSTRRCARRPTSRRSSAGSPTARSTPSRTDHAPHPADHKERPLDDAPPGMVGSGDRARCVPADPHRRRHVDRRRRGGVLVEAGGDRRCSRAAHGGPIEAGGVANLVVFDPAASRQVARRSWRAAATTRPYRRDATCAAGETHRAPTARQP